MKNVAILVPRLFGGGAERAAGLLSKQLEPLYHVHLFMYDTSKFVYDFAGEVVDISSGRGGLSLDGDGVRNLASFKKQCGIDCAISFLQEFNVLNPLSRGRESVIVSERCAHVVPGYRCFPYSYLHNIARCFNQADKVVAVAKGTGAELIQKYGVRPELVTSIYNFIDKEQIREKSLMEMPAEDLAFLGDSKLILAVGRLSEQKNYIRLITQFAKLVEDGEDVKLMIIGTGPQKAQLLLHAYRLGVMDRMKIVEYNRNPFPYYRRAWVYALTSYLEGLPNVLLEAMTLGVPVVSADCLSGPRELLKADADYSRPVEGYEVCENGVLVEPALTDSTGETRHFADAVRLLLRDGALRERLQNNAADFMRSYSNEDLQAQWAEVIEQSMSRRRVCVQVAMPEAENARKVIVYGAGAVGRRVMQQYLKHRMDYDMLCFAVTSKKQGDPAEVLGLPVFEISDLLRHKSDALVVVAVSMKFEDEIKAILDGYGFRYIFQDMPFDLWGRNMYRLVAPFDDPLKITEEYPAGYGPEMSYGQQAFLCGLLREKRPKKLLEVGVAEGGTTGVVLNALHMLGEQAECYSVDFSERFYREPDKRCGFLLDALHPETRFPEVRHRLLLGDTVARHLDDIGGGIDFLILDAAHSLPGELLDMLACLPYLADGAVVVLHDTMLFYQCDNGPSPQCIATRLLFDVVTSERKYLIWQNETELDNIAAFTVTQSTREHVGDLFSALLIPWSYRDTAQLEQYGALLARHYDEECMRIFRYVCEIQEKMQEKVQENRLKLQAADPFFREIGPAWRQTQKKVIVYGAGIRGRRCLEYAQENGLTIDAFVVSDDQPLPEIPGCAIPVYHLSELPCDGGACAWIVAIADRAVRREICLELIRRGYTDLLQL